MYKGQWDVSLHPIKKTVFNSGKTPRKTQVHKQGRCGYSGDRLGRFFRWASSLFLNIFRDEAVTTSAGRSFHIFTTLWLKVNLRKSSLDRSFRSFSGCPRSLEVSAIWKRFCRWSHVEFYRPISCLPCPSYKSMNQDLVIDPLFIFSVLRALHKFGGAPLDVF